MTDHPEVFAKTAFILNYDEAGGFFDHMPPPVPPVGDYRGHSTVSLAGETKDWGQEREWAAEHGVRHPLGLGIRTPTIIVSPWTRGGHVCSQLFDHTSVLRFMEARFGVAEPNISAWRRSVCGDLTSVFDFTRADPARPAQPLPDTAQFQHRVAQSKAGTENAIPAVQRPAAQMPGQRGHRALPYQFTVQGTVADSGKLAIAMDNTGPVGVVLTVHDNAHAQEPWHFTIGAGDSHTSDTWQAEGRSGVFDLTLRGPNGYWRRYAGDPADRIDVLLHELPHMKAVELVLINRTDAPVHVTMALDPAYPAAGPRERTIVVAPGKQAGELWRLSESDCWYDLAVNIAGKPHFARRFAGKVETGAPSRTDPGIGVMRIDGGV